MKNFTTAIICFLPVIILFTGCDNMKTEMDIESISFPPKLSVTAILDAENGIFSIALKEGRALADYAKPIPHNRKIVHNGEIRLFEDGRQILFVPGPFDMTVGQGTDGNYRDGFRYAVAGITTRAGSTYRLEVDADGCQSVTSTAVMPVPPVFSAGIDTTATVVKKNIYEIYSLAQWSNYYWGWTDQYWPVSIRLTDPDPTARDYFAFELNQHTKTDDTQSQEQMYTCGLGTNDLSMLQDNPDMESQGLFLDSEAVDLYIFSMLLLSDLTFPGKTSSFTLYTGASLKRSYYDETYYKDNPDYEKIVLHHTMTLRIKHITTATFKYYRSLSLQSEGMGFFTEPVNIVGNIKNGYGGFSIYSAVSTKLLEYDDFEYRYKGRN